MDYFQLNIEPITDEWVLSKMKELGIKRKDLTRELGLDRSYLSLLFAKADNPRKIHLTKATKGLFYYYFKDKEKS